MATPWMMGIFSILYVSLAVVLVAKVFDHVSMKYIKGFRMLTLGWSDGNSFVPIAHRLMSSSDDKNMLGTKKSFDKRSIAHKRREQARMKATDVMLDMLKRYSTLSAKKEHKKSHFYIDIDTN